MMSCSILPHNKIMWCHYLLLLPSFFFFGNNEDWFKSTHFIFQVHPGALKIGGHPLVACCIYAAERASVSRIQMKASILNG